MSCCIGDGRGSNPCTTPVLYLSRVATAPPPKEFAIRAPVRIDFGGGWTDVPPYDVEQGGFVCNVAIARYSTVRVRPAPHRTSLELAIVRPSDAALLRSEE